jgi:N-acetylglucosaminyldiphosphoundecaprenol N-acetyl-beta-D-mannosaminyltransferase
VDVLGVGVSAVNLEGTLAVIERWIAAGSRQYVCVSGVHGVMEAQRDPELVRIHNASGLTVADGAPLFWAGRFVGAQQMGRVRGPDLLPAVCERAAECGWRCFFYGGAEGTAASAAQRLQERFPRLEVVGCLSPPYRELSADEFDDIIARINAAQPEVVFVALSTPKQERWMARARAVLDAPVLIGIGAALDIAAGVAQQAPRWIQPTGLEWVYRLCREPRRLARRYLRNNPRFVVAVFRRPPRLMR